MTMQPWTARALVAQRAAELEDEAAPRSRATSHRAAGTTGRLALRTGRVLVALGWRLGGNAALPPAVRRRLA